MSILSIEKQEIRQRVELALRQIRPYLEADGGDVSLSEITDDLVVKVELHGACKTCNMSQMTMKAGVEDVIKKAVPEVSSVIAVDRQQ
jgi:Fe-S cluster biogenesis protein NfuA